MMSASQPITLSLLGSYSCGSAGGNSGNSTKASFRDKWISLRHVDVFLDIICPTRTFLSVIGWCLGCGLSSLHKLAALVELLYGFVCNVFSFFYIRLLTFTVNGSVSSFLRFCFDTFGASNDTYTRLCLHALLIEWAGSAALIFLWDISPCWFCNGRGAYRISVTDIEFRSRFLGFLATCSLLRRRYSPHCVWSS
ncbi:hypothetical protein F5Y18DRAFT_46006 [Xylariaceae sp. FL1019]|nr:hypothetical protein F5Y18DRAFT_46006 [Xylariaceae sp. FL1019]